MSVGGPTCIALANGDAVMSGFAVEQLARLEAMGGPEKDMGQYRQIVSWYSELLVTAHLAARRWPVPATFAMEPTAGDSKMNPELVVELDGVGALGVEVKAPDLGGHQELRSSNDRQLNGRVPVSLEALEGGVTLPRDNPMKGFLVGADRKFAGFKAADPEFRSVLVVVWDDFVNELLTALSAPCSGLFTPNSFHHIDGKPVQYPNVYAVLLVRHQHQIVEGLAGRPLVDGRTDLLDYGRAG